MKLLIRKLLKESLLYEERINSNDLNNNIVAVLGRGPSITLFDISNKEVLGYINVYNNQVSGVATKKGFGPLIYELGMALVYPKGLQSDRHGNSTDSAIRIWNYFMDGNNSQVKIKNYHLGDSKYIDKFDHIESLKDLSPDMERIVNSEFFLPDKTILNNLISNGESLADEDKNKINQLGLDFYTSHNL
jgi:hypothetical protein